MVPLYRVTLVREEVAAGQVRQTIRRSADAAALLRPLFEGLDREQFAVLLLDAKHRPIGMNVVALGSLTATIVHPREVFRAAVALPAAAVILAHNHPSGDPAPSAEDGDITKRLRAAGDILGIPVLDHVVLGDGCHFSFCDSGQW
jgi:DNA repair protein RadC